MAQVELSDCLATAQELVKLGSRLPYIPCNGLEVIGQGVTRLAKLLGSVEEEEEGRLETERVAAVLALLGWSDGGCGERMGSR